MNTGNLGNHGIKGNHMNICNSGTQDNHSHLKINGKITKHGNHNTKVAIPTTLTLPTWQQRQPQ